MPCYPFWSRRELIILKRNHNSCFCGPFFPYHAAVQPTTTCWLVCCYHYCSVFLHLQCRNWKVLPQILRLLIGQALCVVHIASCLSFCLFQIFALSLLSLFLLSSLFLFLSLALSSLSSLLSLSVYWKCNPILCSVTLMVSSRAARAGRW